MKNMCVGDKLQIQCYKHNGNVHRAWDEAILLDEQKDYVVFGNNKTIVTKAEGVTWKTKEPAIMYFFKHRWYNIIAQLKKDGISYYCNIATPYLVEDGTIKYIDYDLDLRVYASGEYKILDRAEYNYHKKIMGYSSDLDKAIKNGLDELIKLYKSGSIIFNSEYNLVYYDGYVKAYT
jgi:protein associated with RNAse G/E